MSNSKNPESKPPTIDDVEREIIASDLQPQVRTWLLVLIASARKTETLRAANAHHLVDKTEARVAAVEQRVAKLEEANAGVADAMTAATEAVEAWKAMVTPLAQLEPAVAQIQSYVETMKWAKDARAALDRALAFIEPLIPAGARPPLDGAQIATRAMLDKQIAQLSQTLHDVINRVRRDVSDQLVEINEAIDARPVQEELQPRRLLARWLRRGQ